MTVDLTAKRIEAYVDLTIRATYATSTLALDTRGLQILSITCPTWDQGGQPPPPPAPIDAKTRLAAVPPANFTPVTPPEEGTNRTMVSDDGGTKIMAGHWQIRSAHRVLKRTAAIHSSQ